MRLAVMGDTQHYRDAEGRLCALGPVAVQIDRWAELFDEVVVCAPLSPAPPPAGFSPYQSANVRLHEVRSGGGNNVWAKLGLVPLVFHWWRETRRVARQVDAVHLRCPCNIGLVAIVSTRGLVRYRYAHYAGVWRSYAGEPRSYGLQRRLLASRSFGGPVTVYAAPQPDRPHLVPFFSPSFSDADWQAASAGVDERLRRLADDPGDRIRLATVGRLSANKNQQAVLRAIPDIVAAGVDATLDVVGDGACRAELERLAHELDIEDRVRFHGALAHPEVMRRFADADLNVLATRQEGFGKVLLEGMVMGAVPVFAESPVAHNIAGDGARGVVFDLDRPGEPAATIVELARDPARRAAMVRAGRAYCREVTLDAFQGTVAAMLEQQWHVSREQLAAPSATST